jgi:cobalt-zinc-cadmium efflux system membrane fusion protein
MVPAVSALVLTAATVGAGAANHWRIKPFSELTGRASKEADDWCTDHGVAKSSCVECDRALFPRRPVYGWCKTHGVHECPLCHPEAAELPSPPMVTTADRDRAARALAFTERIANHPKCTFHTRRIQLASADVVRRAGIEFAPAVRAAVTESFDAPAETAFDPTRVARVAPRVPGVVWRVDKRAGDRVSAGEILAVIDSADVGKIKSEFVSALTHLETTRKNLKVMRDSFGTVEGLKLTEAEAAVETAELRVIAARQALASLGNSAGETEWSGLSADDAARRLFGTPQREAGAPGAANLLAITSPLDGIVTASDAAKGDRADPARPLFTVADARNLWLTLAVKLEDALRLARGLSVQFRPDGATPYNATLDWISTSADEKTRTVAARAILRNADGRLSAQTFGAARVILREEPAAVVVPSSAVHWDGNCTVVFVRDRDFEKPDMPKLFHVRSVRPGAVVGNTTEIIAGVLPGEMVAAAGSGALRAELLKASLGAG